MNKILSKRHTSFLLLLCGLALLRPAHASACDMPEGFHEYGTFGQKAVYLYHFPMFGSIHAYQVLVEADFSEDGKNVNEAFFAAKNANPEAIFVTSPARVSDGSPDYWVLPDYSKPGAFFNAKVHFQANGKDNVLFESVKVTVKSVLLNRLLKSATAKPRDLQYLYFGNPSEGYLLHLATWDPDFDQILSVAPLGLSLSLSLNSSLGGATVLQFDGHPNLESARLKAGDSLSATSTANDHLAVQVLKELIEFKIDLQH